MAERGRRGQSASRAESARGRAAAAWGRAAVSPSAPTAPSRRPKPDTALPDLPRARRGHLGLGLTVAAVLGGIALLMHRHTMQLAHLNISGLRQMTPAEVEADLGLPPGTYAWQVRPWVVDRRLRLDPLVASAHSALIWPDGLRVVIVERVPAALLLDGLTAWEVDAQGRLLRALPDENGSVTLAVPGIGAPLPMVIGLPLPEAQAGQILSSVGLDRALAVAASLGGALGTQIRDVAVAADAQVGITTVDGIPVNYGDGSQAARKTDTLLGILALARAQGVRLASCDVSAPATPACQTQKGSPPLVYGAAASGGS